MQAARISKKEHAGRMGDKIIRGIGEFRTFS